MKKSMFLIMLVSLFFVSACSNGKTQSLEGFYKDAEIENVDKIIIQDGSTGASKTITQNGQMDEFLSLINDIQFTPLKNQEKRDGWRYGITLFDGEKVFKFTLNKIGNTYYDTNPDINPIVDRFYKQLESAE
ncbi:MULTISPECIES: hypothetical protein [unclassified Mesobacillus]|uniref:hypothetical protein n=1 Tax=unclassified Mesobacillus TaxID=2675270 RepID=UPI00203FF6C2|nr:MULTISPECIES: hypothetical protein [unclassified Mesobacillus]MCM3124379.1 hypothetical protein [Mesobacillus sp. MER 33]MCM3234911.1 hypothetical protein [Mesobacillus sp. MER 48]